MADEAIYNSKIVISADASPAAQEADCLAREIDETTAAEFADADGRARSPSAPLENEVTEDEIINSQCHVTDHLCRIHDATKVEALSKKTPDEAQRDCRIALEKMLKDHQPVIDCIWRQSTGVIDIEWGDETGDMPYHQGWSR